MALSRNQIAAREALKELLRDSGADVATEKAWKRACPPDVRLSSKSLVRSGVVKIVRGANLSNGNLTIFYSPL